MKTADTIERTILQFPICEYAFGRTEEIPFSEKVCEICEKDCRRYGKCWTCPPYGKTLEEKIAKCRSYTDFCMFSTISETDSLRGRLLDEKAKQIHEQVSAGIREALENVLSDFYLLTTGCMLCETCTCPSAPCRFPDKQVFSMESHGILVVDLADEMDLSLDYGEDTIAFFSLLLYSEA